MYLKISRYCMSGNLCFYSIAFDCMSSHSIEEKKDKDKVIAGNLKDVSCQEVCQSCAYMPQSGDDKDSYCSSFLT